MSRTFEFGMRRALVAFVCCGAAVVAVAGGVDDFKLARSLPANATLAVAERSHEGQAFIKKQYEKVWKAVENAHFEKDVKRIIKELAKEGGEFTDEEFDAQWQQINDLIAAVEWTSLCDGEIAFAMSVDFPTVQSVALMIPAAGKAKASFDGLSAIIERLLALAPPDAFDTQKTDDGDTQVRKAVVKGAPQVTFTLARHKDTLLLGIGGPLVDKTWDLATGKGGESLIASPRFKQALSKLPAPRDSFMFLDADRLLTQIRGVANGVGAIVGGGAAHADAEAHGDEGGADPMEDPKVILTLVGKLIDGMDMFDHVASVKTTDGMKRTEDSISVLKDNAKSTLLYPLILGNASVSNPLKFIPQDAKDVSVWAGMDLSAAYAAVLKFVEDNVPNGKELLAQWEQLQTEHEFNVKNDLLSWIGGEFTSFSVPGKTPYSPPEWSVMVTVRDEAKAREMLDKAFVHIAAAIEQQKGTVSDAEIGGVEGFKTIMHPMLAMMLPRPTLGVAQGRLIFGSSPKVIETALAVAAGKLPGFDKSERFAKEGVAPKGPVHSMSFTDQTKFGEELGQMLQMVQMVQLMPGISEIASKPVPGAILRMVSKLGPIVQKLDFLQSSASLSTFDGKAIVTRSVQNYREPPPPPAPPGEKPAEPKAGGPGK